MTLIIFAESFIFDVWQGSEYTSEVPRFVLVISLWSLIWTGKWQMEIKVPLGKISIDTNDADKKNIVLWIYELWSVEWRSGLNIYDPMQILQKNRHL